MLKCAHLLIKIQYVWIATRPSGVRNDGCGFVFGVNWITARPKVVRIDAAEGLRLWSPRSSVLLDNQAHAYAHPRHRERLQAAWRSSKNNAACGLKKTGLPHALRAFAMTGVGFAFGVNWIATRPPVARDDADWVFALYWIMARPSGVRDANNMVDDGGGFMRPRGGPVRLTLLYRSL